MQETMIELLDPVKSWTAGSGDFCVGEIVQITEDGWAFVDFHGNLMGPVVARLAAEVPPGMDSEDLKKVPVLLVFEKGNPGLPIIVGFVRDRLSRRNTGANGSAAPGKLREIIVDGERLLLDAKREIVLRCGKGSITINRQGRIVVKGTQVVSRASQSNKIKGASVSIN